MFTGIIQAVGEVAALEQSGGDLKLRIKTGKLPLADVKLGDSIATNGVCLTVTELPGDGYWACLLYTPPSPRDKRQSRMPSSA